MIGGDGSSPLLPRSTINATWIQRNMASLKSKEAEKSGGFCSDETPSWVLGAMKSLANCEFLPRFFFFFLLYSSSLAFILRGDLKGE